MYIIRNTMVFVPSLKILYIYVTPLDLCPLLSIESLIYITILFYYSQSITSVVAAGNYNSDACSFSPASASSA